MISRLWTEPIVWAKPSKSPFTDLFVKALSRRECYSEPEKRVR